MAEFLLAEAEYFLRIILAGICGGIVGYERKNRGKGAGIRTHLVVALASALMMIVSKYGFYDIAGADPSRVASSIVTGVGFLGAGIIYVQNRNIRGLTTAAGVWATSGIGMAIGAGMYILGALSTIVIITAQIVLHKNLKFMQMPTEEELSFVVCNVEDAVDTIKLVLLQHDIQIDQIKCNKMDNDMLSIKMRVNVPADFEPQLLADIVCRYSFVELAANMSDSGQALMT